MPLAYKFDRSKKLYMYAMFNFKIIYSNKYKIPGEKKDTL